MGLKKGNTNNPKGRPQGSENIITKELRTVLKNILANEINNIPEVLNKLEPKERLELVIKLIPYVLPKVEPVNMGTGEPLTWD